MTAAFSPIAIAVLYVLAPTLPGAILQSEKKRDSNMYQVFVKSSRIITGYLQVLHTVYIQPLINYPALLAWLHRTSSRLEIRWGE